MSSQSAEQAKISLEQLKQLSYPVTLTGLRIRSKELSRAMKLLDHIALSLPRTKRIVADPEGASDRKLFLLQPEYNEKSLEELTDETRNWLQHDADAQSIPYKLEMGYAQMTVTEALQKLLPSGITIPSSFETVGHVAHLNLRDEHEPYKHLIGQVIMDKNPNISTVVNKMGEIQATFRTFDMEVIAGKPDTNVTVSEGGAKFQFDYAKVYWNSRLGTEHERLVKLLCKENSQRKQSGHEPIIAADMFCGVGPFAVPLAMRGCKMFANDLNPNCIESLNHNIKLNKINTKNIETFNMDARDFARHLIGSRHQHVDHLLMNLPADALCFCDTFLNLFDPNRWTTHTAPQDGKYPLPWVHCYCFAKTKDLVAAKEEIQNRLEEILGEMPSQDNIKCRQVRDVAPKKIMMLISFRPCIQAAFTTSDKTDENTSDGTNDEIKRHRVSVE